jgi:hypothetical protein
LQRYEEATLPRIIFKYIRLSNSLLREPLKIHVLSFLRKQESSKNNKIDSRFRGNDGLLDVPLRIVAIQAMAAGLLIISAIWPDSALALQVHAGSEGLYVHQMAHVFFLAAMVFLFYILFRHPLGHGRAWVYLRLSLLFFSIWNVNAIITHSLELTIPPESLVVQKESPPQHLNVNVDLLQHSQSLVVQKGVLPYYLCASLTFERWIYYVGKFDHLLCVPAMFFLTMALKTFCQDAERRVDERKEVAE